MNTKSTTMKTSRRKFLQTSVLSGIGISLVNQPILAALVHQDSPYKMTPLRNNVGYFTERGGTIGWMITKEAIVVVDTQFPDQAAHLIEAIKKQSDRRINLLINTHHHGDHSSGNIAFKGRADMVLAHENSKKNQMCVTSGKEDTQLYPDTTFTDTWSKKIGQETISLKYFGPAHTNGDAVIHFENANIAHVGDLMFNRRFPYVDKSAGASITNWIVALENIQKKYDSDTQFIFGHSNEGWEVIGGKADLKAFQNFLSGVLDVVNASIKAGKTQEEILAIQSIDSAPEWKGDGLGRSLSAALEELKSN